jgi:hypothetical protein
MQLREARLCLDCEEIHTLEQCPICASEAFAFLTRWLPVDERRSRVRRVTPPAPPSGRARFLTGATAGVAALTLARFLMRAVPAAVPDPTAARREPGNRERRRTDET